MARTRFFTGRKARTAHHETIVGRWLAQEYDHQVEPLRIFGCQATDGRHIRISL